MRIITVKAKGANFYTLYGEDITRPTSERAKEAIFSMIQFEIEGRRVLDLFAGSGQLGLEAMSRGATYSMFVDSSRDAMAVVKKNAQSARMFDECGYLVSDYRSYLRKISGKDAFDIIFLDPPYRSDDLCDALVKIHEGKVVKDTGLIVCEYDRAGLIESCTAITDKYRVEKTNSYGRVYITLLRPLYDDMSVGTQQNKNN